MTQVAATPFLPDVSATPGKIVVAPAVARWQTYAAQCTARIAQAPRYRSSGRLTRVAGLVLEAVGIRLPLGSCCLIEAAGGTVEAEVVGFNGEQIFLMPMTQTHGLEPGARVCELPAPPLPAPRWKDLQPDQTDASSPLPPPLPAGRLLPAGSDLLGRVLDSLGRPLDGQGPLHSATRVPLYAPPFNPLERAPVEKALDVGVRAINALLSVGRGQRLGLFAGSGVGKSVLLGMMARYTAAEVVVVGLIGERGREVKDFVENILGTSGRQRSVVVAAPADTSPIMRLHGAAYATALAEYFRDQGRHVLLIMDSLTRYAMAQREIALAVGEPPATRGYPPSVFARLPALVERAGNGQVGSGSITAFYTVLSEGDDLQDPVADTARAILDGHLVLTRTLADAGHYPALDIEQSISRVMVDIVSPAQWQAARRLKQIYARYQRSRDLIQVGAYQRGSDPQLDEAIARMPAIEHFLQQDIHEQDDYTNSQTRLMEVLQ